LEGNTAHSFEQQITALEPFLGENWKARVIAEGGGNRRFTSAGGAGAVPQRSHRLPARSGYSETRRHGGRLRYLVIASSLIARVRTWSSRPSAFWAPLARSLGPGGRMIAIQSYGHDPGREIIHKVWPNDNPFLHSRHDLLKAVKQELGTAGRDLNSIHIPNQAFAVPL